jgi:transaldolase
MTSKLDQLRSMTTVVADTGDVEAVRRLKPIDCTTNPSIVLKALETPEFEGTMGEALAWGSRQGGDSETRIAAVADRLAVSVGAALAEIVPGRVSTEVDADLSFDTTASIDRAKKIVADYAGRGIGWEGIRAAEELQKKGIDCNLTLLFSKAQATACADAGVFLISPFVGRIYDWYVKSTGKTYAPEEDPGVLSVRSIYNYYKAHDIQTVVMGASFRSTGQIEALAGCDRLTIAPNLLEQLAASEGQLERKLSHMQVEPEDAVPMDEKRFRWAMNEDAMATEKLAEGIRLFAADAIKLERFLAARLEG